MSFQLRSNSITFYRLFFIALFIATGIIGLGVALLENFMAIEVFATATESDKQALIAISAVMWIIGISLASLMVFLMQERRNKSNDRRRLASTLDFAERRGYNDRRLRNS